VSSSFFSFRWIYQWRQCIKSYWPEYKIIKTMDTRGRQLIQWFYWFQVIPCNSNSVESAVSPLDSSTAESLFLRYTKWFHMIPCDSSAVESAVFPLGISLTSIMVQGSICRLISSLIDRSIWLILAFFLFDLPWRVDKIRLTDWWTLAVSTLSKAKIQVNISRFQIDSFTIGVSLLILK
jgi:hypothetical protein